MSSTLLCESPLPLPSCPPPADRLALVHRHDTFLVLSCTPGWLFVCHDTPSSHSHHTHHTHDPHPLSSWVPAGTLLETSIPVSSAIKEPQRGPHRADINITMPHPKHPLPRNRPAHLPCARGQGGRGGEGGVAREGWGG